MQKSAAYWEGYKYVLARVKIAEDLPGYLALRGSVPEAAREGALRSLPYSLLLGAPLGAMAGAFHPGLAKTVASDKARMLGGLLAGGLLSTGVGAGTAAGLQGLANVRSEQLEKQLRAQGQIA